MTDQSVREAAARAYTEHLIGWAMTDDEWEAARSSTEVAAIGAALAAVADHDGLADAFWQTIDLSREDCERLADVVRAWLLDQA